MTFKPGQQVSDTNALPVKVTGMTVVMPESLADGADVTQGAKADAVWSGAGDGSTISILKAIWAALAGIGAKADAVWSGAGAGSIVAIAKGIFAKLPALGAKTSDGSLSVVQATDAVMNAKVADGFFTASASFSRQANTTLYAAGKLLAPNPAVALEFTNVARAVGEAVRIERVRMRSNKTPGSIANASFIAHLFRKEPTLTVADNGTFNTAGVLAIADIDGYIGPVPITFNYAAAIGARGVGVPTAGAGITCEAFGTTGHERSLWVLLEVAAGYQSASGETIVVTLEGARS